jgi:hypothetical protein
MNYSTGLRVNTLSCMVLLLLENIEWDAGF